MQLCSLEDERVRVGKIEPMAVAFGNTSLFHKVKDINLFAAELQYYDIDFVIIPFSEH